MEQRDYLLKQAEQLGQVLGKIFSKLLNLRDNSTVSMEMINPVFAEKLDFDVRRFIEMEDLEWITVLQNDKRFNTENFEKLADIFLFIAENANMDERNKLYKKSLMIYKYLEESENTYSFDRNYKINKIIDSISSVG
jgi:hypothetical protein